MATSNGSPRMSRAHFALIADVLASASYLDDEQAETLARDFVEALRPTNPRFKSDTFTTRALRHRPETPAPLYTVSLGDLEGELAERGIDPEALSSADVYELGKALNNGLSDGLFADVIPAAVDCMLIDRDLRVTP